MIFCAVCDETTTVTLPVNRYECWTFTIRSRTDTIHNPFQRSCDARASCFSQCLWNSNEFPRAELYAYSQEQAGTVPMAIEIPVQPPPGTASKSDC